MRTLAFLFALVSFCLSTAAPAAGSKSAALATSTNATVTVDVSKPAGNLNPYVLGNNVAWAEESPEVLYHDTLSYSNAFLDYAQRLAPTMLRYPGGTDADLYHWQRGVGPVAGRGTSKLQSGDEKTIYWGTDEFLSLCITVGAEPLITVNVATGTPEEAAAWVAYTNTRPGSLMRVKYWEIGNEPYLEPVSEEAAMTPEVFAARANAFIRAMKGVDPTIIVGIPLRSDRIGQADLPHHPGFNDKVLPAITEPFEYVAVHNSYWPVTLHKKETAEETYLATMAASRLIESDMAATRQQLQRYFPGRPFQIAVTEYNTLYSLDIAVYGLVALFTSDTDRRIDSLASALYTIDALMTFAAMPDLLTANFWSLNGNWWFGAIGHDGEPRATFHALEAYRKLVGGRLLPTAVSTPTISTPAAGWVPAMDTVPLIRAQSVLQADGRVEMALINRSLSETLRTRITLKGRSRGTVTLSQLTAEDPFDHHPKWATSSAQVVSGSVEISLPPHSATFATIR